MEQKLKELIDKLLESRVRRAVALVLAIVVTFTTTYTLVLPAITLEKDTAETMAGVNMGGNEQNGDTSAAEEGEDSGDNGSDDSNSDTIAFDAEAKNEDGATETLVHVEADIDAFPEGTTMEATVVTDQDVIDNITEAAEGEVVAVRAVDLTFTDENGETVQASEGSQLNVTLSAGEGVSSSAQNEDAASDSAEQLDGSKGEEASAGQNTETTVVQYTEDKGAETVETNDDVTFQVEPENDLDQDNAVSFDMAEQTGDQPSQTFAIVETVPDEDSKDETLTDGEREAKEAEPGTSGNVSTTENEIEAETEENPDADATAGAPAEEQEVPVEEPFEEYAENVLTAQDDAYIVTMTYGPEADIPQDAYLRVEEIVEAETYDTHLEETQKALNEAVQTERPAEEGVYAGPAAEEPQFFGARSLMSDPDAFDRQKAETETAPAASEPEIVYARFFDITILDGDGNEVTPAAPVKVAIELLDAEQEEETIQNADSAQVVHFGEEKTEVMQAEALEDTIAGVSFDAEGFSVYGVVYTQELHSTFISAAGETYEITVTYDEDAQIPDDADLKVREILADTEEYQNYLNDSAEELGLESVDGISFARFFDIEIIDKNGEKIEPKTAVQVKIAYKDAMEKGLMNIVHFGDQGTEIISDVNVSEDGKEVVYEQDGFSVTGTIVSSIQGEHQYMILIKYPNNSDDYYVVNNDGTLTKVNYNSDSGTVDVTDPMLWTVTGTNPNRHIYFHTEATGFNQQQTASDYYRRYIDPSAANAITEENSTNVRLASDYDFLGRPNGNHVSNRSAIEEQTSLSYSDSDGDGTGYVYKESSSNDKYLGVELDDNGTPVRLIGQQSAANGVEIVFAEARNVPAVGASTHTVDHIDISISGTSNITVPLAFGTYYYKDSANQWREYSVLSNTSIELTNNNVSITAEDMKGATIKAYDKNGKELDDAFVITGYSSNDAIGQSTVQVRIEGRFKVADLERNAPANNPNNTRWKDLRYNNKITYSVSATKPLTYDLVESENGYGQLYEKLPDGTYRPLSVTVDVNMAASFDYWDERNECPALNNDVMGWFAGDVHGVWQNGGIPASGYPAGGNSNSTYLSGMDFKLGGNAEDADSKIVAIEITKMIVDQDGNLIPLKNEVTQSFDIYGSGNDDPNNVIGLNVPEYSKNYSNYEYYAMLHSKDMKVGTSGMGLVYDYDITPGMYYIEEDSSKIPQTIVSSNDEEWQYVETRVDTEYVWRNDMYSGHHVSATYKDPLNESYKSIPEVAGNYYGLQNPASTEQSVSSYNSATWIHDGETGTFRNGFLEFFVYNVYKKVESETDITLKKVDKDDLGRSNPDYLKGASFTLTKYDGVNFQSKDTEWGESGSKVLSDTMKQDGTYTLNGVFPFEGLTEGFYMIEETGFPAGYVKLSSDPTFKVELNDSKELEITLINNPDNMLRLEDDKLTIIVGNTPGAALPNTGGPGTNQIYLLGIMLTGIAGMGLVMWKKRSDPA